MEKYVIVTGASKGIGKAIVEKCASEGYTPICVARTAYTGAYEAKVISIKLDLSHKDCAKKLFEELALRRIKAHYLVNNAGGLVGKKLLDLTEDEIEFEIQMNLRLPILISKEFLHSLGNDKAVIVNISSLAALNLASDTVYGATKSGINGLTRCLASHYAPNVRVNAVAPGFIPTTDMGAKVPAERAKVYIDGSLTKIPIETEAIADMVSYLLSDKAKNITGATYEISNGVYLR